MGIRNKERIETNIVECFAKYSQVNIKVERNVSITCNKNVIHHQRKWRNTRVFKIKQNGFRTPLFHFVRKLIEVKRRKHKRHQLYKKKLNLTQKCYNFLEKHKYF